jgi:inositol 1,4,5-triphosphate receptor type 1
LDKIQQFADHFFTLKIHFQGDVLRNFLLVRYFGRNFIQKKETVDLGKRLPIAVATHGPGGEDKSKIYFLFRPQLKVLSAKILNRAGRTLHEVQSHLDREGGSDLVVELVIKSVHSPSIFVEAVELGIAMLEGGNSIIQRSMHAKLLGGDLSQAFFKV